jgi:hypothetical protein
MIERKDGLWQGDGVDVALARRPRQPPEESRAVATALAQSGDLFEVFCRLEIIGLGANEAGYTAFA